MKYILVRDYDYEGLGHEEFDDLKQVRERLQQEYDYWREVHPRKNKKEWGRYFPTILEVTNEFTPNEILFGDDK